MGTYKKSNITRVIIYSFARQSIVEFNADIQSFTDTYAANVNSDAVYGRIDPISTYSGTKRDISFSLLLDSTTGLTSDNFFDIKVLASRMYGRYKTLTGDSAIPVGVLHSPPLFALNVSPLVVGGLTVTTNKNHSQSYMLPGFITNFSISYDATKGVEVEDTNKPTQLIPREMTINISFSPIHDRQGGFDESGAPFTNNWPF